MQQITKFIYIPVSFFKSCMSFDNSSVTFLDLYNLCMYSFCDLYNTFGFELSIFKPGACWHAWFLIIAFVYEVSIHTYMPVSYAHM